jgi:hypothetical protein
MPSLLEIIQTVVALMIGVSVGIILMHALGSEDE